MEPRIGLALGAGGAKGLAHIGVLQVLEEEGIPVHFLAGVSMGAIIGAAYAAGTNLKYLAQLAENLNQSMMLDLGFPRMGLLKGHKALEIISLLTHKKDFIQLDIPLAVQATDIERGEKIIFREGNLAQAVRASMSIPGIFYPVEFKGKLLVDGAVVERVPAAVLHEMGADYVIAVDVKYWPSEKMEVKNIYDVIMQSIDILENEAAKSFLEYSDVVIKPDMSKIGGADFSKGRECVELGRIAAREKIEEIKEELAIRRNDCKQDS